LQGKEVQQTWHNHSTQFDFEIAVSASGWMQSDILLEWFERVSLMEDSWDESSGLVQVA
jgi:hypothetical protein